MSRVRCEFHWLAGGTCRTRAVVLLVAALVLVGLGAGGRAAAYQFLREVTWEHGKANFAAEPNMFWSPEVWPPNGVLSFVIEDSTRWILDIEEVRRIVEEAMAFWSAIPSADIRWEVARIVSVEESRVSGLGPMAIRIRDFGNTGTLLTYRKEPPALADWERAEIVGCRVGVSPFSTADAMREYLYPVMVHELGHCLGLAHTGTLVDRDLRAAFGLSDDYNLEGHLTWDDRPAWWRPEPIMNGALWGGWAGPGPAMPSDRIGASLLRPRPRWLASVGSLYGNALLEDGEGASFVQILVSQLRDDGTLAESFVRFTDPSGVFVVGGLDPGRYMLQARPIIRDLRWFQQERVRLGAAVAVRPTVRAAPVVVSAGRRAGPITLTMRRGENLLRAPQ